MLIDIPNMMIKHQKVILNDKIILRKTFKIKSPHIPSHLHLSHPKQNIEQMFEFCIDKLEHMFYTNSKVEIKQKKTRRFLRIIQMVRAHL